MESFIDNSRKPPRTIFMENGKKWYFTESKRKSFCCTISDCFNGSVRNGLCNKHTLKKCSVDSCENTFYIGSLCQIHKPVKIKCSINYCPKTAKNNGLCGYHFRKSNSSNLCVIEGCKFKARTYGKCKIHGGRLLCKVDGCTSAARKDSLCMFHGSPEKKCKYEGCMNNARFLGICRSHGCPYTKCSEKNCTRNATHRTLCYPHLSERIKNGTADDSMIQYKLKQNLRGRLYTVLHKNAKSASTMELLGCSIEFFKQYIEAQFPPGVSWKNFTGNNPRTTYHIDHIRPCSSFDLSDPEQQKICFHYSNLRPMLGIDNIKKGSKLIY